MHDANARRANDVLERANRLLQGHGVEALRSEGAHVDNYHYDIIAAYVNLGDTYATTLVYDTEQGEFLLTSYGDFLEGWEAVERRAEEEADPEEDVCVTCGEQFPMEEMVLEVDPTSGRHEAQCRNCYRDPLPTWDPRDEDAVLIAVLRAVEGQLLAVHYLPHADQPYTLAFSIMQTADHLLAYMPETPYSRTWPGLVDAFKRQNDLYVAGTGRAGVDEGLTAGIERSQFQRLTVAMDAAMETGMERQPVREFLEPPPVLWTCVQIVGCVWDEERGDAAVECYVRPGDTEGWSAQRVMPGADVRDLSVWSARTPEVEQLVEDGFIKWGDDESVRRYLKELRLCR